MNLTLKLTVSVSCQVCRLLGLTASYHANPIIHIHQSESASASTIKDKVATLGPIPDILPQPEPVFAIWGPIMDLDALFQIVSI